MGRFKGCQKRKYICKICSKSCPSGWSLGGHMRLHSNSSSKKHWEMKIDPILEDHPDTRNEMDPEYKDPDLCSKCKKCDKEFGSIRALFGHMKCHSSKKSMRMTTPPDDNDDWETLTEVKSFICQTRRKRSRTKYNSMREEIEEDVAECLMLLSRGAAAAAKFESSSDDQINKSSGNDERTCNGLLCNADDEQLVMVCTI